MIIVVERILLHVNMKQLFYLLVIVVSFTTSTATLEEVFSWKQIEWKWPSQQAKDDAIKHGEYIPGNSMPNSFLRWKDKLFVTVPR